MMSFRTPACRRTPFARATVAIFVGWVFAFVWPSHGAAPDRPAPKAGHGFAYHHDEVSRGPWSIHIVKVNRSHPDLELQTTLPKGHRFGLATLSEQAITVSPEFGRPVAALNGDYFNKNPHLGDPKGLQISQGELISGPCDWTCFWIDAQGNPHMTNVEPRFTVTWPDGSQTPLGLNEERTRSAAILYTSVIGPSTRTSGGREMILERNGTNAWLPLRPGQTYSARVKEVRTSGDTVLHKDILVLSLGKQLDARAPKVTAGSVLQISTETSPSLAGASMGIGGGPAIVRDGKAVARTEMYVRHPRAAIGWNRDFFFLVEVDGRQRNLSVGMTLPEFADYLVKLGCTEAMNLDGGGSATFWVYGQVMNSPSEGHERGMANALVLIQKEKR